MTFDLGARYGLALERHLSAPTAETLSHARALGGELLQAGDGLLELSGAHHRALRSLYGERPRDGRPIEAAQAFFDQVLVAFELASYGYRDAHLALEARNAELETEKEQLEATSREREWFGYSVSHDLRAPLRAIDGFGRALEEDNGDQLDAIGRGHLRRVREATRRMTMLIDDLLRLAGISRGELERETVDLSPRVTTIVERLRRAEPLREVELALPPTLLARADPRLLSVVLENLLSNAWKFTSKRPSARLEVGLTAGSHTYFVKDNGAGFDMRYVDRLFGAFERLHTSQEFEGTGIGLATVQRIVRRHGGRIWAEGTVGAGASFYFTLGE